MGDVMLRSSRHLSLAKLLTTVQGLDEKTADETVIKCHLEAVETHWDKLNQAHENIISKCADATALKVQFNAFEEMEECYTKIKLALYALQKKVTSVTTTKTPTHLKLPDMSLPTFDGKYEDWPTFQDLFSASIHCNSSLSGSQKLQYLKSCLRGEAASTIKSFLITDANYNEAWTLLVQQYNNEREIITSHVRRLLFQPPMEHESAAALQAMLTLTLECLRSLKALKRPTDTWDDIICALITDKFDRDTKAEWSKSLKGTDPPTFKEVQDFIQQHIRTLHAKSSVNQSISRVSVEYNSVPKRLNTHHSSVQPSCQHCGGDHQLFQCTILKDMSPDKRFETVKLLNLCLNCLRTGHSYKECRSSSRCKKCNKPHNTFLHLTTETLSNTHQHHDNQQIASSSSHLSIHHQQHQNQQITSSHPNNTNQQQDIQEISSSHINNNTTMTSNSSRLLKTALVDVLDKDNVKREVRVFIDEGAEGSLIKESTLHQLGLNKHVSDVIISGVCGTTASKSRWMTNIRLHSQVNNSHIDLELHSVPQITNNINQLTHHVKPFNWNHINGLRLADPFFHESREIDILIGADTAPYIFKPGIRRADRTSPVAQDTIFGWVISGNVVTPKPQQQSTLSINHFKFKSSDTLNKEFSETIKLESTDTLCSKAHGVLTLSVGVISYCGRVPADLQPARYRYQHDHCSFNCFSDVLNCITVSADLQPAWYNYNEDIDMYIPKCFGVIPSVCRWHAYLPSVYFCSNSGTNFVDGLRWIYDPLSSPHPFDLLIARVNNYLQHRFHRVVGDKIFHLEEFTTLLGKKEACFNSRLLCVLSSVPFDFEDVFIGNSTSSVLEPDIADHLICEQSG